MEEQTCHVEEKVIQSFKEANKEEGIRVFVAGGSRSGNDTAYAQEAYNLGKKIVKMDIEKVVGIDDKCYSSCL